MAYFNTTGYQPNPQLAKMMTGGGLGGFLSNLGGVMNKSYTDMKKSEDDLEAQRVASFNADTNREHVTNSGNYYNSVIADNKRKAEQESFDRATAFDASAAQFREKNPNAGVPSAGDIATMPMDTQTAVKGWMVNENQKIAQAKADKDLLSQRAFEMAKIHAQKTPTSGTSPFGSGVRDIYVDGKLVKGVDVGNGTFTDGTSFYPFGKYSLTPPEKVEGDKGISKSLTDGSQIIEYADGRKVVTKEPSIGDKNAMQEFDSKATQYVNKAFEATNGKWQKFNDYLTGADNSEKAPQAKAMLHSMYKKGELSGMTEEEAMAEAYKRVGAPIGLFGARTTEEQQNKAFSQSVISGNDESKITPDIVEQYFKVNNIPYTKDVINVMTNDFKNRAQQRLDKSKSISDFSSKYGLNIDLADRISNKAKDTMLTLTDNTVGSNGLNIMPKDDAKYVSEKANSPRYNTNWSIGNEQIDVAPVLVELAKYAPTVGMNPVAFGSKFANILGNAAMFGSADGMMAELYGDDWRTAAAYGAIPMGAYGAFMKAKKATPKP